MPTKVTIYTADGEMRDPATKQYDPRRVGEQLHTISWLVNRLRADGYEAAVVLDTGAAEMSLKRRATNKGE